MAEASGDSNTFAAKLATLRDTIRRPDGKRYTLDQIAAACRDYTGDTFSKQYVSDLLSGKYTAPTQPKIEALANFFGVPAAYFFNDALSVQMQEDLRLGAAIRVAGVRGLAARMLEFDSASRETLTRMLEKIAESEDVARPGDVPEDGPEQ